MFHSQTWLSFCDAAPRLTASSLPWIGIAIAAALLVSYIAVEYGLEPPGANTEQRLCGMHASTAGISAEAPCGETYHFWYPSVAIGDMLSPH